MGPLAADNGQVGGHNGGYEKPPRAAVQPRMFRLPALARASEEGIRWTLGATLGASAYWYERAYVQRRSKVSGHLGPRSEMTAMPCQREKGADAGNSGGRRAGWSRPVRSRCGPRTCGRAYKHSEALPRATARLHSRKMTRAASSSACASTHASARVVCERHVRRWTSG